ncbi:MAG: GatB/YqeY domain-containing protein [Gammaproteobacteria bacterium]|nr:GatB/YqeY domain-containing protein [Gammaproteobacteria bacterium]
MSSTLKQRLTDEVKVAMKAGQKDRVAALRLLTAALKQQEVDQRIELDDTAVLAILDKQAKQRRESISQYEAAGREDLAATERFELALIQEFLPQALTEAEIDAMIEATLSATGATGMRDMGKVMAELRPRMQGRADLAAVSAKLKQRLG